MALSDHVATLDEFRRAKKLGAAGALATLRDLIARGQAIAVALDNYERKRTRRLGIARATVVQLAADIESFVFLYFADFDYPPALWVDARAAQTQLYRLLAYRRGFASAVGLEAGDTLDMATPQLDARRLVPYLLRMGDSLERIALRYLGDIGRSWEIVELNGLQYPYLRTDRPFREPDYQPGDFDPEGYITEPQPDVAEGTVRVPGQTLWLPSDANVPEDASSFTALDVELYGRDFQLQNGFLVITAEGRTLHVEGQ